MLIESMCNSCKCIEICMVYGSFMTKGVQAIVNKCPHAILNADTKDNKNDSSVDAIVQSVLPIRDHLKETMDRMNKIKMATASAINKDEDTKDLYHCDHCGQSYPRVHTQKCNKCGKRICENCAIEDAGTKKTYCSTCYSDI